MNELINRAVKIWAYTVSHSVLILRSPMKFPDQEGYSEKLSYNIDVEFSAVTYIDIPNTMQGIVIHEIEERIPEKMLNYKLKLGFKVFEIVSEGKFYYIVAGSYRIGKNRWISEDRISNILLEYDEILETT